MNRMIVLIITIVSVLVGAACAPPQTEVPQVPPAEPQAEQAEATAVADPTAVATERSVATATLPVLDRIPQTVLFEVEYMNFAWVPTWRGIYVDGLGDVYSYDLSESTWEPADPDAPTEAELLAKYDHNRQQIGQISTQELIQLFEHVEPASKATLTKREQLMNDAGVTTFVAYQQRGATASLDRILLQLRGDWQQTNPSPDADALVKWLTTVVDLGAENWIMRFPEN